MSPSPAVVVVVAATVVVVVSATVVVVVAATVVVVVSPTAVVVVVSKIDWVVLVVSSAGTVVVVVSSSGVVAPTKTGLRPGIGLMASTGRNSSWPVVPTAERARSRSVTPGSCTSIWVAPILAISGSWTLPSASIRRRMISTALSRSSSSVPSGAWSTTLKPPCRSRPSRGVVPLNWVAASEPHAIVRVTASVMSAERRDMVG